MEELVEVGGGLLWRLAAGPLLEPRGQPAHPVQQPRAAGLVVDRVLEHVVERHPVHRLGGLDDGGELVLVALGQQDLDRDEAAHRAHGRRDDGLLGLGVLLQLPLERRQDPALADRDKAVGGDAAVREVRRRRRHQHADPGGGRKRRQEQCDGHGVAGAVGEVARGVAGGVGLGHRLGRHLREQLHQPTQVV